jgi:hypothetical protein
MTRRLAVMLVAAAVLLGGATGWTVARFDGSASPSLGSGGAWINAVGRGWFLGAVSRVPTKGPWTTAIDLIAPHGSVRNLITVRGFMDPVAWSGDGRRVLLSGQLTRMGASVNEVVDLTTGEITPIAGLPAAGVPIDFTRPDGLELLNLVTLGARDVLQRRTLNGGKPVTLASDLNPGTSPVSTPDGQALYVSEPGGIKLVSNLGTGPVATVPDSAGCAPVRLWTRSELLAQCGDLGGTIGHGHLEVLPVAGGHRRLIANDVAQPITININAFAVGKDIYTATSGGCGAGPIGRIGPGGAFYPITSTSEPPVYGVLTSNGTELAAKATDYGCENGPRVSLVWLNPQTFRTRTLFSVTGRPAYFLPFPTYNGLE